MKFLKKLEMSKRRKIHGFGLRRQTTLLRSLDAPAPACAWPFTPLSKPQQRTVAPN
jgi:hypothetical protein